MCARIANGFAHEAHAMRGLLDTMPTTLAGVREAMQNLGYDKD